MNRRDVLAVLGIGAGAAIGTEKITARAAELKPGHFNDEGILQSFVPQIDVCGYGKQLAIAEALEALAGELRASADNQKQREAIVAQAKADGVDHKPLMPAPVDETWATELSTKSSIKEGFLDHEIVIRVEMYHKA